MTFSILASNTNEALNQMTDIDRPGRYDWPFIVVLVTLVSLAFVSLAIVAQGVLGK